MKENNKPSAPKHPKTKAPKRATLEDIKSIKGYELLSDAEAQGILTSIRQFASLMTDFMQKHYGHE